MEDFDFEKLHKQPASVPEGMFKQVRQRLVEERIRIAQTHRQLMIGSALLLVVGAFNIGNVFLKKTEKQPISNENIEQILYKTYFDNAIILSNEQ